MTLFQFIFKTPEPKKKTKVELLLELAESLSKLQRKQFEQYLKARLKQDADDFGRQADVFLAYLPFFCSEKSTDALNPHQEGQQVKTQSHLNSSQDKECWSKPSKTERDEITQALPIAIALGLMSGGEAV